MGFILLEGGNEFKAGLAAADRRAMAMAGGQASPVRIIPAAAAPDENDLRAGANGVAWFKAIGATDVRALPITDRASAGRPEHVGELKAAGVVFMLGGFTRHLADTLADSPAWEAIKSAHRAGAVIGGSSAGAMALCEFYFDPASGKVLPGLNLLSKMCVLPHHNTFGQEWAPRLAPLLPGSLLVGIDEETGLLNDGPHGQWTVYGCGAVTVYGPDGRDVFHDGQRPALPVEVNDQGLTLNF